MIQIIGQNIPLINFTLTNCLRGATTTVKNNDQEKYVYGSYGIAFDGKDEFLMLLKT